MVSRFSQAISSKMMVTQTSAVNEELWKETDWKRSGRSVGLAPVGTGTKSVPSAWKEHTGQWGRWDEISRSYTFVVVSVLICAHIIHNHLSSVRVCVSVCVCVYTCVCVSACKCGVMCVFMRSCGCGLCTQFSYLNAPPALPATARYPNVSGSPVDRVTLTQAIPASSATVNIPLLGPASKHTAGGQEQISDTLLLYVSLPFIYLQPDYCMTLTIHTHSDHSLRLSYKHFEALVVNVLFFGTFWPCWDPFHPPVPLMHATTHICIPALQ